jgi:hypothetical protein
MVSVAWPRQTIHQFRNELPLCSWLRLAMHGSKSLAFFSFKFQPELVERMHDSTCCLLSSGGHSMVHLQNMPSILRARCVEQRLRVKKDHSRPGLSSMLSLSISSVRSNGTGRAVPTQPSSWILRTRVGNKNKSHGITVSTDHIRGPLRL